MTSNLPAGFGEPQYCYLTTTGRKSGKPHTIEIWFVLRGFTLYLLSGNGEKSDWVRNLRQQPNVSVRIENETRIGRAREMVSAKEDEMARDMLVQKYQPGYDKDLADWRETALPVAIEMAG